MKHQYSIDELKHREAQMQLKLEEEQAKLEKLAEHKVPHRQLACPGLAWPGHESIMECSGHIKR